MNKYVERLVKCGFSAEDARSTCIGFLKDFSLFELNNFVLFVEGEYVDKI